MRYTQVPLNTFKELQMNAGVIAKEFNTTSGAVDRSDIIGATSGGINFTATPTFSDFGEDIDNMPKNTKELKRLESWEVTMSGTFVTVNADLVKILVSVCDKTGGVPTYTLTSDTAVNPLKTYYTRSGSEGSYVYTPVADPVSTSLSTYYEVTAVSTAKITPRNDLSQSDFIDKLWFAGDYSDKTGDTKGGNMAIKLINVLSTGGFQIQTTDRAKGKFAFTFTGHYSIVDTSIVPFEIYMTAGEDEPAA